MPASHPDPPTPHPIHELLRLVDRAGERAPDLFVKIAEGPAAEEILATLYAAFGHVMTEKQIARTETEAQYTLYLHTPDDLETALHTVLYDFVWYTHDSFRGDGPTLLVWSKHRHRIIEIINYRLRHPT